MRPLNFLALANSIAAYALLHGNVQNTINCDEAGMIDQGEYGDTHVLHDRGRHTPDPAAARAGRCAGAGAGDPRRDPARVDRGRLRRNSSPGEHVKFELHPDRQPDQPDRQHARRHPRRHRRHRRRRSPVFRPLGAPSQQARSASAARRGSERSTGLTCSRQHADPELTVVQDEQTPAPGDNKVAKDPVDPSKLGNDIDPPKAGNPGCDQAVVAVREVARVRSSPIRTVGRSEFVQVRVRSRASSKR